MESRGTVVILAAGQGKRMQSRGPKVLQPLCGRPMLAYVLEQALSLDPARVLVVVGVGADAVRATLEEEGLDARVEFVVQEQQLGTGHAVLTCLPWLRGERGGASEQGWVVVLYGDMPLLQGASIAALLIECEASAGGLALLTAEVDHPRGFGRVVRRNGGVQSVVEERDATPEERALREVNVGVYAFSGPALVRDLPLLGKDNAQGEYYLTDLVGMAVQAGRNVRGLVLEDPAEAIGVNNLSHLAEAREELQRRILEEHLAAGVYIEDPRTAWIDWGVAIGARTRVLPSTVIRRGVVIGEDCEVGPFTHLREGTRLERGAEVGNFTEVKKSTLGERTKAKHLSYLGDVTIGKGVNIGAGTIVANYDGKHKHPTQVGDGAFVGSGTVLVAPVDVGAGALTGAGAVVTSGTQIPPREAWVGVPARRLKSLEAGGVDGETVSEGVDVEGRG
jgi:bifunctional UDP-N-acetylglucosamine pyrophosphorylase/glucosamine-1-phosphate N-acetyltransferase